VEKFALLFVVIGYLLGSIPFGYLVTRITTGRNILEIGWRKTSGSNVFKNIGFWQGFLTGIGDVGKGFLAVWLAQKFGLPIQTQALSGVAAVTGHNYSCFLKFAGGRGIGTLIGAFLALSPGILGYSLIPLILLALIWNASIGTIFFLITAIVLATNFGQLETIGLLPLVSLLPIFIKRLSPIKELSWQKKELMRNRLIFDNDQACLDLRIKRIIQRLTKA
jgi:glycerol-3-phosphate acyltransferase PlsY